MHNLSLLWNFYDFLFQTILDTKNNDPLFCSYYQYVFTVPIYNISLLFKYGQFFTDNGLFKKTSNFFKLRNINIHSHNKNKQYIDYLNYYSIFFINKVFSINNPLPNINEKFLFFLNDIEKYIDKRINLFNKYYSKEPQNEFFPVDANPTPEQFNPDNQFEWNPLIIPNGNLTQEINGHQIPVFNLNDNNTLKKQPFLGPNYGKNLGFCLKEGDKNGQILIKNINMNIDWEKEIIKLKNKYENLNDIEKVIAELFAASITLPPPSQLLTIFFFYLKSLPINILNQPRYLLATTASFIDAGILAWYYKAKFNQARPVQVLRIKYENKTIKSWQPYGGTQEISGRAWLPYQDYTFVTPPFPDFPSGHSLFTCTFSSICQKLFNTNQFSKKTIIKFNKPEYISPILIGQNEFKLGTFIVEPGYSTTEPGLTPQEKTEINIPTFNDLAQFCSISRFYGGIHWYSTHLQSMSLANYLSYKVIQKLNNCKLI
jgi:hypothetical protein